MAKAKKRAAARKKSSKRGKASVKPARKMAAKRAMPKKAKSKVSRSRKSATKPAAEEMRAPEAVETTQMVAEIPVETTIITAIEEPAPGAVVAEEYQSVQTVTSGLPGGGLERGEGTGPTGHVDVGPDLGERPEQKVA